MIKYFLEVGYPWIVSTEIEYPDGTEVRVKRFIVKRFKSLYVRLQYKNTVRVLSTNNGYERVYKPYNAFKLVVGIYSE